MAESELMIPVEGNEAVTTASSTGIQWMNRDSMNTAYKAAQMLSKSALVPTTYQGKPENILIAMDIQSRMSYMSLMTIMQNLYIVQGKPSWAGQFCIAAIEGCGKFKNVEFLWMGESGKPTGCSMQAVRVSDGKLMQGVPVTDETVRGFGWDKKSGSMWNIPGQREQMFMYRAAAYFARTFCPEVLMGLYTVEEQKDISGKYSEPAAPVEIVID